MTAFSYKRQNNKLPAVCSHRQIQTEVCSPDFGNTEKRLKFNEQVSERQSGIYPSGFKNYNNSKKIRVGMIENGIVIKEFDSVADALKFLGKPTKEAGNLLKYADKYNKNGKRAKTFGYSLTKLSRCIDYSLCREVHPRMSYGWKR